MHQLSNWEHMFSNWEHNTQILHKYSNWGHMYSKAEHMRSKGEHMYPNLEHTYSNWAQCAGLYRIPVHVKNNTVQELRTENTMTRNHRACPEEGWRLPRRTQRLCTSDHILKYSAYVLGSSTHVLKLSMKLSTPVLKLLPGLSTYILKLLWSSVHVYWKFF